MAQVNAGRVRFIGRGEYDNSTQYYTFDLVYYNGNSYFAKSNTMGNLPTNSTYWQLVAEKGNVGPEGPTGNGIDHISLTSQSGATKVYTIYYTDGTTSEYTVQDGEVTQEVFDEEVDRLKMIYNAMPKVSGEGTDLTLDNTAECPVYDIELRPSELEQESTSISGGDEYDSPSPEHPQDIHVVSGDNSVIISNKNLAKETFDEELNLTGSGQNRVVISFGHKTAKIIRVKPNTNYTFTGDFSSLQSEMIRIGMFDDYPTVGSTSTNYVYGASGLTFTTNSNTKYIMLINSLSIDTTVPNLFVCETPYASTYEPRKEQTYPISLGDLEYCKIGDYGDVFFKNVVGSEYYDSTLELDKWYLKKNINNITINVTGEVRALSNGNKYIAIITANKINATHSGAYCTNAKLRIRDFANTGNGEFYENPNNFVFVGTDTDTIDTMKSKYNDSLLYYVLATPTYTLLNSTLQTQLDNLWNALSYQGQTNVSQTNNDLPFVIKLSAIRDLSGIFEEI